MGTAQALHRGTVHTFLNFQFSLLTIQTRSLSMFVQNIIKIGIHVSLLRHLGHPICQGNQQSENIFTLTADTSTHKNVSCPQTPPNS